MSKIIEKSKKLFYSAKKKIDNTLYKAKIRYPKIFDSRYNKKFVIASVIVLLSVITSASYATFVYLTSEYRAADIRMANLMYSIKVDEEATKTITVNSNSVTTFEIDLDALNEINSKYLVYYTSSNNLTGVKVEYSNLSTSKGEGKISPTGSRRIRIVITNDSSSNVTLNFNVKGGYVYNNLNLNSGEYKIDGIYDERSNASGDIIIRTYLNGKMVEEMPSYSEMQNNHYIFDEIASSCTNGATISYIATSSSHKLEVNNVGSTTECIAVFHDRRDVSLTVVADDLVVSEIPDKNSGYVYESSTCNNGATIAWDNDNWTNTISNVTQTNTNCVIRFKDPNRPQNPGSSNNNGSTTIIDKYTENNTEGLIMINQSATSQTPALTEYRYTGSSPKNYVTFNNETWRIIGVFEVDDGSGNYEQRIKIIRDASIGNREWDASNNDWSSADLNTYLNGTYYNGLSEESRNMISESKWYTAATTYNQTTSNAYKNERGTTTSSGGYSWTGKIGLMYLSDYGYGSSSCYSGSTSLYDYNSCTSTNWLFNSAYQWTLAPRSGITKHALHVYSPGYVDGRNASSRSGVRPVTYLTSSVKITGGEGTSSSPYELSL